MVRAAEQVDTLVRSGQQAVADCAETVLQGAGQVLKLQLDATQQVLAQGGEQLRGLWSQVDPFQSVPDGLAMVEDNVRQGVEMTRAYLDTVTRLQNEFAHIIDWQAPTLTEKWREAVQASLMGISGAQALRDRNKETA